MFCRGAGQVFIDANKAELLGCRVAGSGWWRGVAGSQNKNFSMLGSPYFGKLPNVFLEVRQKTN